MFIQCNVQYNWCSEWPAMILLPSPLGQPSMQMTTSSWTHLRVGGRGLATSPPPTPRSHAASRTHSSPPRSDDASRTKSHQMTRSSIPTIVDTSPGRGRGLATSPPTPRSHAASRTHSSPPRSDDASRTESHQMTKSSIPFHCFRDHYIPGVPKKAKRSNFVTLIFENTAYFDFIR